MAKAKLDLTKNGHLTQTRSILGDIKGDASVVRSRLSAIIEAAGPKALAGFDKAVISSIGRMRSKTLSYITFGKEEVFDNILTRVQEAEKETLSNAAIARIREALEGEDSFKGVTFAKRLDQGVKRAIRAAKIDIVGGQPMNAVDRLSLRGRFAHGVSLEKWTERLLFSELNRYAQHLELEILKEMGYTQFAWVLSALHSKITHVKNEICEQYAKAGPYSYKKMLKLMPPHPYCMCHPEGIE